MLDVGEVDVVQVLGEMIATVERALRFGLAPTLLVSMSSHMSTIRAGMATERTNDKLSVFYIAADPCSSKCMD